MISKKEEAQLLEGLEEVGKQPKEEEEEGSYQDAASLAGDMDFEMYEGEVPEELKKYTAKEQDLEIMGCSVRVAEALVTPWVPSSTNRKIVGGIKLVLRRAEEFKVMSIG